jgi:hypothetical protein
MLQYFFHLSNLTCFSIENFLLYTNQSIYIYNILSYFYYSIYIFIIGARIYLKSKHVFIICKLLSRIRKVFL